MSRWHGQVKTKDFQQKVLHSEELFFSVGVIRDVNKLIHFRWVHLLIFPGEKTNETLYAKSRIRTSLSQRPQVPSRVYIRSQ